MKLSLILLLLLSSTCLVSQESINITGDVLGHGFDIRYIDALDWERSSKGRALLTGETDPVNKTSHTKEDFHFITTAYDFEQLVLKADTLSRPYLAMNSESHYNGLGSYSQKELLLVYTEKSVPLVTKRLLPKRVLRLDSAMVEDFRRLDRDITPSGFIARYGTHYAEEVTYGGLFLKRNSIAQDDFIYSPYDKSTFKSKVIEDIKASHGALTISDPYIHSGQSNSFTIGGDDTLDWFDAWEETVATSSAPINVRLQPFSKLFTALDIPDITNKELKIKILDSTIQKAIAETQQKVHRPEKSMFYKKYSLRFAQTLTTLVKKSAGVETEDNQAYTGDLFFGGYSKDDAVLKTAPFISRGGIRLETLITDEELTLNKRLVITVKPEDLERGYVSVWDDTKKLVKSKDRKRLRISGPEEAKTAYKEALTQNVRKNVEITTIDGDMYEVQYILALEKEKKLLESSVQEYNNALQTEIIAAANIGDLAGLKSLLHVNKDRRINGLIPAIITSKQSDEMLNIVLDEGVKATVADLDLLFLKENYDVNKILILLERGTPHKNNMLYKAVAYKSEKIIYALLREGAIPKNNDLTLALENNHYPTVKALMSVDFDAIPAGKNELLLAAENNDADLAKKFVSLGATADAYVLDKILKKDNDILQSIIVPVTEASNSTLEVVATYDNADLFKYFVSKNASLTSNKSVEIATDNNNAEILDLALKNGGEPTEALAYAIKSDKKFAIDTSLKNKAKPDMIFSYAVKKEDAQLFNDALSLYGGTPSIALQEAVKENNISFAESVIQSKREEINTSETVSLAVSKENLDMVKLLVANDGNPSEGLREAINVGSESITDYLVNQGAETLSPELIKNAVKNENLAIAKILVEKGESDVNNAIVDASETGNAEITKYLLDKGAKTDEALMAAMETTNEDVILLLLDKSSVPRDPNFLLTAARKGNTQVVKRLLDEGVDPSLAIEGAVRYKNINALNQLLDRGGVPEINQLHTAFQYGFISGALLLIKHPDIDVNQPFYDAEFAVHKLATIASNDQAIDVLTALKEADADFNALNEKGQTLLHVLAEQSDTTVKFINLLVNAGANPLVIDTSNNLASDLATDRSIKTTLKKAARNQKF